MIKLLNKLKDKLSRKSKTYCGLLFVLASFMVVFLILLSTWIYTLRSYPEEKVYFSETFNSGADKWESLDSEILNEIVKDEENSYIRLSSKKYTAPYSKRTLEVGEILTDSFVFNFQVKPNLFTGDSITLASLVFSSEPIVIVADQQGRIGLSSSMFTEPSYSNNKSQKLKRDQWNDIYLQVDARTHKLILYVNGVEVLNKGFQESSYPLNEIWLGTIWTSGAGNYGAPLDIAYENIKIGNEGVFSKPAFFQFTKNLLNSACNFMKGLF